jgi:hypothetical protein
MTKKGSIEFTRFDGTNTPDDFNFPSIEIEDIDRAVFDLFDKQLRFEVEGNGKSKKIPVIFAAGERFALTRRKNPIRDNNEALILPLISIQRGTIDTSHNQHGYGTAIAYGDTPGYYVKRRLAKVDRNYQNIINKQGIKNQDNVSARKNFGKTDISPGNTSKAGTIASRRNGRNNSYSEGVINLSENLGDNIFEIIEVPYPKFMAIKYEVTFWCQYMTQMNQVLQNIFINYGQGHEIPLKTVAGFDLMAFFSDNILLDTNISSYSSEERIIKYKLEITITGYMINPRTIKGVPKLLRSYFSAPQIEFGYEENDKNTNVVERPNKQKKDFILSDIENVKGFKKEERGQISADLEYFVENPFNGEKETKYSKIISSNKKTGESVISPLLINKIEKQYE